VLTHFTHPTGSRAYSLLDYSFKAKKTSLLGAFIAISAVLALPSVFDLVPHPLKRKSTYYIYIFFILFFYLYMHTDLIPGKERKKVTSFAEKRGAGPYVLFGERPGFHLTKWYCSVLPAKDILLRKKERERFTHYLIELPNRGV